MRLESASSAPARSIEDTARSTSALWTISWIGSRWTSTSNMERSIVSGFSPWLIVRLPSIRSPRGGGWGCLGNCRSSERSAGLRLHPRRAPRQAGSVLAVPVVDVFDPADQADAAPRDLAGARVVADVVRVTRPVGEELQAVEAGTKRVRDAGSRGPRDDGASPHLMLGLLDAGCSLAR